MINYLWKSEAGNTINNSLLSNAAQSLSCLLWISIDSKFISAILHYRKAESLIHDLNVSHPIKIESDTAQLSISLKPFPMLHYIKKYIPQIIYLIERKEP